MWWGRSGTGRQAGRKSKASAAATGLGVRSSTASLEGRRCRSAAAHRPSLVAAQGNRAKASNLALQSVTSCHTWCSKCSRPPAEEGRAAPPISPQLKWSLWQGKTQWGREA